MQRKDVSFHTTFSKFRKRIYANAATGGQHSIHSEHRHLKSYIFQAEKKTEKKTSFHGAEDEVLRRLSCFLFYSNKTDISIDSVDMF